jgi:hypothetical protein
MGYVLFIFTHCAHMCKRARARLKHSLIFGRILFKFAGHMLQMTKSYMGYILIMFTHACASARVINCSLTYGRFLFKFAVNILQITISSKGYVLSCSCTAHTCARARVRARTWLHIQLSWTDSLQMW